MLLTIVFLILTAVFIYICYKRESKNKSGTGAAVLGAVTSLTFVFLLIGLIVSQYNFKTYIQEYEVVKTMISSYKGDDYGNMNELTKSVVYINDKIATHKAQSNSLLLAGFYSKEVGSLEPLTFNMRE